MDCDGLALLDGIVDLATCHPLQCDGRAENVGDAAGRRPQAGSWPALLPAWPNRGLGLSHVRREWGILLHDLGRCEPLPAPICWDCGLTDRTVRCWPWRWWPGAASGRGDRRGGCAPRPRAAVSVESDGTCGAALALFSGRSRTWPQGLRCGLGPGSNELVLVTGVAGS